jgi:hypothetical protein
MVELEKLRVSLTKNGYLKIAEVVRERPSHEILNHAYGSLDGVNLQRSQVRSILSADPISEVVPSFWDDIRAHGDQLIKAFTFLAIVFSHHRLIRAFLEAGGGRPQGHLSRTDLAEKEFTNLAYAMAELGLCAYQRGAPGADYDLGSLPARLKRARRLVDRLLRTKLQRCGWKDPDEFPASDDFPFLLECRRQEFHKVLGMSYASFNEWLTGHRATPRR